MTKRDERSQEPNQTIDLTSKTTLTCSLAKAVCDYKDIDPLDSGFSLYEYLDTDALDDLVTSVSTDLQLQFAIDDVVVCIEKPDSTTATIYVSDRQQ